MMSNDDEKYPLALPVIQPPYRTLHFIARHGNSIAVVVTGAFVIAGFLGWGLGYGVGWVPASIAVASFIFLMLRCLAELVHLIVDTMIPK